MENHRASRVFLILLEVTCTRTPGELRALKHWNGLWQENRVHTVCTRPAQRMPDELA